MRSTVAINACHCVALAIGLLFCIPPKAWAKKLRFDVPGPVNRLIETATDTVQQQAQKLENAGKRLEDDVKRDLGRATREFDRMAADARREVDNAVGEISDAANAIQHFGERQLDQRALFLEAARRVREGRLGSAVWHLGIDRFKETEANVLRATQESRLVNAGAQVAATAYGGPGGGAAYAAWATYKRTGDADLAIRTGVIAGLTSAATAAINNLPVEQTDSYLRQAATQAASTAAGAALNGANSTDITNAAIKGAAGATVPGEGVQSVAARSARAAVAAGAAAMAAGKSHDEIRNALATAAAAVVAEEAEKNAIGASPVKQALIAGSIGGLAVAAAGGNEEMLRDGFVRGAGQVLVQEYVERINSGLTEVALESQLLTAATVIEGSIDEVRRAQQNLQLLAKDVEANARSRIATMASPHTSLLGTLTGRADSAIAAINGQWIVSWDKKRLVNGAGTAPAVVITYAGEGSPIHEILTNREYRFSEIRKRCIDQLSPGLAREPGKSFILTFPDGTTLEMIWINRGEFVMGTSEDESSNLDRYEEPQNVVLTKGFWIGKTEVTIKQWAAGLSFAESRNLLGRWAPSMPPELKGSNENEPVRYVDWGAASFFCNMFIKLMEGDREPAGYSYALPTEAQWEYACRANAFGESWENHYDMAWYSETSDGIVHGVATKKPNAWGLHDMHGNVAEWCEDHFKSRTRTLWRRPTNVALQDPCFTDALASKRVVKGGSFQNNYDATRTASRTDLSPNAKREDVGFRLVLAPRRFPEIPRRLSAPN